MLDLTVGPERSQVRTYTAISPHCGTSLFRDSVPGDWEFVHRAVGLLRKSRPIAWAGFTAAAVIILGYGAVLRPGKSYNSYRLFETPLESRDSRLLVTAGGEVDSMIWGHETSRLHGEAYCEVRGATAAHTQMPANL